MGVTEKVTERVTVMKLKSPKKILPQLGVNLYLAFFNCKQNVRIEEKTCGLKKKRAD